MAAIRRLAADAELLAETKRAAPDRNPIFVEADRNRAAAVAWCHARGLSVARTVRGARWPDVHDQAADATRGAGPKWQRQVDYCRANGLEYT